MTSRQDLSMLLLSLCCSAALGCGGAAERGSASPIDTSPDAGDDAGTTPGDSAQEPSAWPDAKYIAIDALYQKVRAGDPDMLLLNVSDEEFYNMGHIAGSIKIPWDVLGSRLGEVDSSKHVVIYCRRGVRSESAYTTLLDNGYSMVWVMEGGLEQWIEAGYPTVPD